MKKHLLFLSIILLITFLCSCAKKEEQKYSIEEVSNLIIGKWQDSSNSKNILTFNSDQSFTGDVVGPKNQNMYVSGTYNLSSLDNIKLHLKEAKLGSFGNHKNIGGRLKLSNISISALDCILTVSGKKAFSGQLKKI